MDTVKGEETKKGIRKGRGNQKRASGKGNRKWASVLYREMKLEMDIRKGRGNWNRA